MSLNILGGSLRGALLLLVLAFYTHYSHAHLPELFGREYIRFETPGNPSQAPCGQGEQLTPSIEDESQYENELRDVEISGGPYATGLSDPYIGLGYHYLKRGNAENSLKAYRHALHLVRINDGLYSTRQVPILRKIMEIYQRQGDTEALNHAY